jgi:hypothetical protein
LATGTAGACALTAWAADVFSLSTGAAGDSTLSFGSADFYVRGTVVVIQVRLQDKKLNMVS